MIQVRNTPSPSNPSTPANTINTEFNGRFSRIINGFAVSFVGTAAWNVYDVDVDDELVVGIVGIPVEEVILARVITGITEETDAELVETKSEVLDAWEAEELFEAEALCELLARVVVSVPVSSGGKEVLFSILLCS